MKFFDPHREKILSQLTSVHYEFPSARQLEAAMSYVVTDYITRARIRARIGRGFEARALLVVGSSRVGKTAELDHVREEFDLAKIALPGGRCAKMIKVTLSGYSSWKTLGASTLSELGFETRSYSNQNQNQIWDLVAFHAEAHGVVCIHYDECQHIFRGKSKDVQDILIDCFKSLLKRPSWPLILILSGVEELKDYILREEQLRYLVKTITFDEIDPNSDEDLLELNKLCFAYADRVGVDFTELSNSDFYQRLAFACSNRWGLVINLLFDALVSAALATGPSKLDVHFCRAFTEGQGLNSKASPFSIDEYEKYFDRQAILNNWLNGNQ